MPTRKGKQGVGLSISLWVVFTGVTSLAHAWPRAEAELTILETDDVVVVGGVVKFHCWR